MERACVSGVHDKKKDRALSSPGLAASLSVCFPFPSPVPTRRTNDMDGYTPFTFYPATYASGQHGRTKENSPEDTALPQLPNSSYPYGAYTSTYQQPVVQPQSPLLASSYHAQQPGHRLSDRVLDDPAAVTTNPGVMDMSYAYGQGPNSGGTAEDYSPAYSDDADANADDFDSDSHLGASSESKPTLPATARKSVTSAATGPASESKAGDLKKKRVVKSRGTAPAGVVITEKSCLRCRVRKGESSRSSVLLKRSSALQRWFLHVSAAPRVEPAGSLVASR